MNVSTFLLINTTSFPLVISFQNRQAFLPHLPLTATSCTDVHGAKVFLICQPYFKTWSFTSIDTPCYVLLECYTSVTLAVRVFHLLGNVWMQDSTFTRSWEWNILDNLSYLRKLHELVYCKASCKTSENVPPLVFPLKHAKAAVALYIQLQ
jgi:hypothetical protein